MQIAGLMPVKWNDRRMFNFDLSDIVAGESLGDIKKLVHIH